MPSDYLYNQKKLQRDSWDTWKGRGLELAPFLPLISAIAERHGFSAKNIESLPNATNAVFKIDDILLKIFLPEFNDGEYGAEVFGLEKANSLGVPAPKLLAHGLYKDRYDFYYIFQEKIEGESLYKKIDFLTEEEKYDLGKELAAIVEKLHIPVEDFRGYQYLEENLYDRGWNSFPIQFKRERLKYLKKYIQTEPKKVLIHGDLHIGNILIDKEKRPIIIDFGDACLAPPASDLPAFLFCILEEPIFLRGFIGTRDIKALTEEVYTATLIHGYGYDLVDEICENPSGIEVFRKALEEKIVNAMGSSGKIKKARQA